MGERATQTVESKVGLLLEDGSIVDLDGTSPLVFEKLNNNENYYFCVRHRNHLDVISSNPILTTNSYSLTYDFTMGLEQVLGSNQQLLSQQGKAMMIAGDYDGNNVINSTDFNIWHNQNALLNQYVTWDVDFNGVVNNLDFNLWKQNSGLLSMIEANF